MSSSRSSRTRRVLRRHLVREEDGSCVYHEEADGEYDSTPLTLKLCPACHEKLSDYLQSLDSPRSKKWEILMAGARCGQERHVLSALELEGIFERKAQEASRSLSRLTCHPAALDPNSLEADYWKNLLS